jgi:hypothetical protein
MKNIFYFILIFLTPIFSYSQDSGIYSAPQETKPKKVFVPTKYIGESIGYNNMAGLVGFIFEANVYRNFSIAGGLGIDNWGGRVSFQVRHYRKFPFDYYYGLGYSFLTGVKDFEQELEVEPFGKKQKLKMNLNSVRCVNLSIGKPVRLGSRLRLNFEMGYSIPLQTKFYDINTPGARLTKDSEDYMFSMSPGGLIFGITFSLGLK